MAEPRQNDRLWWPVLALGAGFFLLYLCFLTSTFMTGDAVVYLDQMRQLDLVRRCAHFGYYVLGMLFTRVVPLNDTLALNAMSAAFAAIGIGIIYAITYHILQSRLGAAVAALSLGLGRLWMLHAVFAQYIIVQTCLTWVALYCWLVGRRLLGGLSFGAALLVTPLSALSAPLFFARRFKLREGLVLMAGTALVYGPFLALRWRDLLWAPRGVFTSLILDPTARLTLAMSTVRVGYHTALEFTAALALALVGVAGIIRSSQGRRFLLSAFASFAVFAVFGVSHCSNWFFLPLYPFVAVTIGAGADWLRQHATPRVALATVGILLASEGVGSMWTLSRQRSEQIAFHNLARAVQARRASDSRVLADWDHGLLFEHYNGYAPYSGQWVEVRTPPNAAVSTPVGPDAALASTHELWAIDDEAQALLAGTRGTRTLSLVNSRVIIRGGQGTASLPQTSEARDRERTLPVGIR